MMEQRLYVNGAIRTVEIEALISRVCAWCGGPKACRDWQVLRIHEGKMQLAHLTVCRSCRRELNGRWNGQQLRLPTIEEVLK